MDFGQEARLSAHGSYYNTCGQKQMLRKINKPLVEKKRRARINTSLQQLKSLVVTALSKTDSKAKLEKADILEMTVKYIRNLQRQQYANTAVADPNILNKYRAGFMACIKEVSGFLTSMEGLDLDTKARVLNHLATALTASASPQAKRTVDLPSSSSDSDDSPTKEPAARKQLYPVNDLVSAALLDSGIGAELDDEEEEFDEKLLDASDYSQSDPIEQFQYENEHDEGTIRDHVLQSRTVNTRHERHDLENVDENNNNFSLPPITHVFSRTSAGDETHRMPETSQRFSQQRQPLQSRNNNHEPTKVRVLQVRSGNSQERFGKMYNALTKPIFRKPYFKYENGQVPVSRPLQAQGQWQQPQQQPQQQQQHQHQQQQHQFLLHAQPEIVWRPW